MVPGAVRAHEFVFAELGDVTIPQAIHTPRFRLPSVLRLLVEPTIEDFMINCQLSLACIGEAYVD